MTNEELEVILNKAEDEYESLKDRCHDLYNKLNTRGIMTYIKKEDLNKYTAKHFIQDLISVDDLLDCIEMLDEKIENLERQIEDREQDISENYRRIPISEQVDISDRDFV